MESKSNLFGKLIPLYSPPMWFQFTTNKNRTTTVGLYVFLLLSGGEEGAQPKQTCIVSLSPAPTHMFTPDPDLNCRPPLITKINSFGLVCWRLRRVFVQPQTLYNTSSVELLALFSKCIFVGHASSYRCCFAAFI